MVQIQTTWINTTQREASPILAHIVVVGWCILGVRCTRLNRKRVVIPSCATEQQFFELRAVSRTR
jgi:hypothetical protein